MRRQRGLERALVAVAALVLVSTVARFLLSRGVDAPWIAPDEQLYGLLGRALVAGDGLSVLGERVPYYSFLYPLLVGLPFVGTELSDGVRGVQALQALLMSATAIPVYLWARPVAGARWALFASALAVLIPGLVYSGLLMSEALYYPAATLAAWTLARCLREPTLARQGVLLGAIALALLTRLQAVGFVGVLVAALALYAFSERSAVSVRRMLPTLGLVGAAAVVWVTVRIALGGVGELLGAYAPLTEAGSYSVVDIGRSIAWHTGALALLTIAIPLVALGVLAWETLRARESDPDVRALVATALAYLAVTVVEVSAFASRFVDHVTERQLLSVAPPVFVAFAVWLHRGLPRPQPATSIVAFVVAVPTILLPLDRVATPEAAPDAPSMISLEQLRGHLSEATFETLFAVVAAIVLALAVVIPRRSGPVLAGIVAAGLLAGTLVASREIRDLSQLARESVFAGAPVDWVDAGGARDATLLVTGDRPWPSVWHELFWNESVTDVARIQGVESPGLVPQVVVTPRLDGRLATPAGNDLVASYVAAPSGATLAGRRVASSPASHDQPGVTLWETEPPVRLTQRITGIRPNGDVQPGDVVLVKVFSCGPGRLELTLLGKEGLPTRVLVDREVVAEQAIVPEGVWRPSIPAPSSADGRGVCVYRLETDGLVGSTRIEWVPAPTAG